MSSNNWLFVTIVAVIGVTAWIIATNDLLPDDIIEMLEDEEMWP